MCVCELTTVAMLLYFLVISGKHGTGCMLNAVLRVGKKSTCMFV